MYASITLTIFSSTNTSYNAIKMVPYHIKEHLDRYSQEVSELTTLWEAKTLRNCGERVAMANSQAYRWIPSGYVLKYGVERYFNAEKARAIIARHPNKFNLLRVTEKFLYHIPGRPDEINSHNYLVVAETVFNYRDTIITPDIIKQLILFARYAGHYDLHPGNYVIDENDIACIIDTDSLAMPNKEELLRRKARYYSEGPTRYNYLKTKKTAPQAPNHVYYAFEKQRIGNIQHQNQLNQKTSINMDSINNVIARESQKYHQNRKLIQSRQKNNICTRLIQRSK